VKRHNLGDYFSSFIDWINDYPPLGFFLFVLIVALSTLLFLPGSIVLLLTGYAFHQAFDNLGLAILLSFLAALTGGQLGSVLALLIGRFILQAEAEKKLFRKYRILAALNRSLKSEGIKLIFLMRLCPIMPFLVLNYLFGITPITVLQYFLGGFGMIPNTLAYVYFGTAVSSISGAASGKKKWTPTQIGLTVGGVVLMLIIIIYITIVTKRYLYTNYESQIIINDNDNEIENEDAVIQPFLSHATES
jgi:uncharacterized membrane protein YdjX (TVP38/TMEM64 family)